MVHVAQADKFFEQDYYTPADDGFDAQSLEGYQVKGTAERDEKLCQNI